MRIIVFIIAIGVLYSCSNKNENSEQNVAEKKEVKKDEPKKLKFIPKEEVLKSQTVRIIGKDSLALINFFHKMNGKNWNESWDLEKPVNEWQGVEINDNGRVMRLLLPNNNLKGNISGLLDHLEHLDRIDFTWNQFEGEILLGGDMGTLYNFKIINNSEMADSSSVRDSVYYVWWDGIPFYNRDMEELGRLYEGRRLIMLNSKTYSKLNDTINKNGFLGQYMPFKSSGINEDTFLVFTGFLSHVSTSIKYIDKPLNKDLYLVSVVESMRPVKKQEDGTFFLVEGENDSNTDYYYQNGVHINHNEGWEWGGQSLSLDTSFFTPQEAYLIGLHMLYDKLAMKGITITEDGFPIYPQSEINHKISEFENLRFTKESESVFSLERSEGMDCVTSWHVLRYSWSRAYSVSESGGC